MDGIFQPPALYTHCNKATVHHRLRPSTPSTKDSASLGTCRRLGQDHTTNTTCQLILVILDNVQKVLNGCVCVRVAGDVNLFKNCTCFCFSKVLKEVLRFSTISIVESTSDIKISINDYWLTVVKKKKTRD